MAAPSPHSCVPILSCPPDGLAGPFTSPEGVDVLSERLSRPAASYVVAEDCSGARTRRIWTVHPSLGPARLIEATDRSFLPASPRPPYSGRYLRERHLPPSFLTRPRLIPADASSRLSRVSRSPCPRPGCPLCLPAGLTTCLVCDLAPARPGRIGWWRSGWLRWHRGVTIGDPVRPCSRPFWIAVAAASGTWLGPAA